MIRKIGYACVNTELQRKKVKMHAPKMATVDRGGEKMLGEMILANLDSLQKILEWNKKKKITVFRIGSDLFPWMVRYNIHELYNIDDIHYRCLEIGDFATKHNIRLTFHPGAFNVLCSPDEDVVNRTIQELNDHSTIFDLMGFKPSPYNKINIHVGGTYGDKQSALERWKANYYRLNENTRKRLTIENDDKASMYSVKDLMQLHEMCNRELPIVFDYFHHKFNSGGWTEQEALTAAVSTWPRGVVPVVHYSESRREEYQNIVTEIIRINRIPEDQLDRFPTLKAAYASFGEIKEQAHSDMVHGPIESYEHTIDVMIEAKQKEQALFGLKDADLRRKLIIESIGI